MRPTVFAKRERIFKPFQRADAVYFLSRGLVFHNMNMLRHLGDVFGEEGILTFGVYQGMATALTFVDVLSLNHVDLMTVVSKHPAQAAKMRWKAIGMSFRGELARAQM